MNQLKWPRSKPRCSSAAPPRLGASQAFMAGTLCLADAQLTAFQAHKKLIRLKIEFMVTN